MESQRQAIRVRDALNKIIDSLIAPQYRIPGGGQTLVVIQRGIQRVNQQLFPYSDMADDRIVDFFVYQLYLKRESRYRFTVADLFSDTAIQRYRKQFMGSGKSGMNYYINQWLNEEDITRAKLVKMIEKPKPNRMTKFIYMESDELIKRRFYNTDMGYMMCQRSTTGWSPRSELCQGCKFNAQCKESTNHKFPELVRLRTEDYGKEK